MKFFGRRKSRYTLEELALRRQKRADVVKSSLPLFAMVLMLCLVVLLSLLCLKPWWELRDVMEEHKRVGEQLEKARDQQERARMEYMFMIKNPEYFEIRARDNNNLQLPEENVIRIIDAEQPLR